MTLIRVMVVVTGMVIRVMVTMLGEAERWCNRITEYSTDLHSYNT